MVRGWKKLFLILICLITPLFRAYATEVYLLSQPITRTDTIGTKWIMGNLAADMLTYKTFYVAAAYYTTGSKTVAAGVALDGIISEVPSIAFNTRMRMKLWSAWKNRKQLKEIANIPGVSNVRIITSGQMDNHSYMTATLHSRSMVFVETDGTLPTKFEGSDWIHLKDLADSKLNMSLTIGGEQVGPSAEIPIDKLFQGTSIDGDVRNEWIDQMKAWEKGFYDKPEWKDRVIQRVKKFNPLKDFYAPISLDAKLKIGDQLLDIGTMADGKSVHGMLGNSLKQRLMRTVRQIVTRTPVAPEAKVKVKSAEVIESAKLEGNACANMVKRALGTLYIKNPASE